MFLYIQMLPMNQLRVLGLVLVLSIFHVDCQTPYVGSDDLPSSGDAVSNFRPSLAVVIGILCVMFSLTFFLLVYAKFCRRGGGSTIHGDNNINYNNHPGILHRTRSHFSGIDKKVVESLPFFKFSALKGSKQGLECAVCLSKFEDVEILRLLPKCKHAFHIACIDQWLEKHSSCPLCRQRVSAEDPTIFTYSNSMRFLRIQSEFRDDSNMEIYVQREQQNHGSSRFSIGSSFRKSEKGSIENEVLIQEQEEDVENDEAKIFHKVNHKIIVSDVVFKNRWSSVSSSDLMFLNSEMMNDISSSRFSSLETSDGKSIKNEEIVKIKVESAVDIPSTSNSEATSKRVVDQTEKRSMSEITGLSRFRDVRTRNRTESLLSETETKEERIRRLWFPIARRTVQWFANREKRSQQFQNTIRVVDV